MDCNKKPYYVACLYFPGNTTCFETQNTLFSSESVFKTTTKLNRDYNPPGLDGSSEIHLKLLRSLDRETKPEYDFTITAYDGGSPPQSADLRVKVEVTDQNDNQPVFLNSSYSVTIDGRLNPGHVILRVSATDDDKGDNSR